MEPENTASQDYENGFLTGVILTAGLGRLAARAPTPRTIRVSRSRFPESAQNIDDAVAAGKPNVLTIDRAGAASRRRESLRGTKSVKGKDRDEFPPAMFEEGGRGAFVRPINPSDNRGAGACIGAQCRSLPNGSRVRIQTTE